MSFLQSLKRVKKQGVFPFLGEWGGERRANLEDFVEVLRGGSIFKVL